MQSRESGLGRTYSAERAGSSGESGAYAHGARFLIGSRTSIGTSTNAPNVECSRSRSSDWSERTPDWG